VRGVGGSGGGGYVSETVTGVAHMLFVSGGGVGSRGLRGLH